MQTTHKPAVTAFLILIAALAFYAVLPFWWGLTSGQVFQPDLVRPIAYSFAALFGILFLLRLNQDKGLSRLEHRLCLAAVLTLLLAPALYYAVSRAAILGEVLYILEWLAALALVGGLIYFLSRRALTGAQKAAMTAALLAAVLAPFMPWWGPLRDAGLIPDRIYILLWAYGLWVIAGIWCLAAWLMIRGEVGGSVSTRGNTRVIVPAHIRRFYFAMLVIGLGVLMIGMHNPVGYSSQTYWQETYVNGQLTNSGFVDLASLNVTALAGMGLILFPLLILLMEPRERPR